MTIWSLVGYGAVRMRAIRNDAQVSAWVTEW